MQRIFDVLLSGIAIIVLSPMLLLIATLLRFTGEGEVFYSQERIGKDGRLFKLYKLATMLKDSPNIGTGVVTVKDDPRVLPIGSVLRKTKINELPQLINVFVGDMSIVGPRPQALRCFNAYPMELQEEIVKVRPGLSGIGSIVFRNEEGILSGNDATTEFYDGVVAPYKGQVEAWYVENQSLSTYFLVVFVTIWIVLFPKSGLAWKVFKGLPTPPCALRNPLNYSETR